MTKSSLSGFDLIYNVTGIVPDFFQEGFLFHFSFCDISKFHFPVCCQFRFAQFFRYQFQKLFCFGSQIDFISSLFHKEGVEKFFNNICSGGNCAKSTGFSQRLCCLCIF